MVLIQWIPFSSWQGRRLNREPKDQMQKQEIQTELYGAFSWLPLPDIQNFHIYENMENILCWKILRENRKFHYVRAM